MRKSKKTLGHLLLRCCSAEEKKEEGEEWERYKAPRASRAMVTGTMFGHRRGRVWFCVQVSSQRPMLLVELPIVTAALAAEIDRSPAVRLALESLSPTGPLRCAPLWTAFLNGRRLGTAAARRRPSDSVRSILAAMGATTAGAGVLPSAAGLDEVMYIRANFEHVVGGAHSESFHLINPGPYSAPSHDLSVFLLRPPAPPLPEN